MTGIYKIESKINPNRIYIGSAININKRWWNHLSDLKKNRHHSIILQNHYNKYGKSDLIFIVIEPCFPEFLIIREQYYVDELNPYFNVCKIVSHSGGMKGKHHSEETIIQMKKSHKGCKAWNKGSKGLMVSWNKTPILQYDKEGNFIREWDCGMYAEKELLISGVHRSANRERKTAGGFIWKHKQILLNIN